MLQCKKCSADLSSAQVQQGISKDKTMPDGTFRPGGKPYKYVLCNCGNREFLPFGVSEKKPAQVQTAPVAQSATTGSAPTKMLMDIYSEVSKANVKLVELEKIIRALSVQIETKDAVDEVGGRVVKTPEDIAWEE